MVQDASYKDILLCCLINSIGFGIPVLSYNFFVSLQSGKAYHLLMRAVGYTLSG
jgi:hypothetical protein